MSTSFLSAATVSKIHDLQRRGLETVQLLTEPDPIQLRRRDATTGNFANAGTAFTPERITLHKRMEQAGGANSGLVEFTNTGEFVTTDTTRDIRRDDRFALAGVTCVVTMVAPDDPVKRVVQFEMLGG